MIRKPRDAAHAAKMADKAADRARPAQPSVKHGETVASRIDLETRRAVSKGAWPVAYRPQGAKEIARREARGF